MMSPAKPEIIIVETKLFGTCPHHASPEKGVMFLNSSAKYIFVRNDIV